ncbi:MAG TPA: O-antigen ligase family protein [Verrucomicrobiae bacterium]|nr:O-antigen ligase family protein [Verrucomicrobiae bacterium]
MASKPNSIEPKAGGVSRCFPLLFGIFLGLALLKFCNPPVMEKFVESPTNGYEWVIGTWPTRIAYWLLALVTLAGLFSLRWEIVAPRWLVALPLVWLIWQFLSATQSVNAELTVLTLKHFTACVVCFYLGLLCLNREGVATLFLWPIAVAFALVIAVGFNQHFGGLQETRDYFFTYIYPTLQEVPPEYLKKISSNRIFSTVFYPNALAGAILLLLPPLLAWIWQAHERFTAGARAFLCGAFLVGALGCLYWSGSKGGWLLALGSGLVVLLNQNLSKRLKTVLVCSFLVIGITGFVWKYAGFFQRGATSVVARFDYWEAAWKTAVAKPILGSGPGTFGVVYAEIKRPESEMARLAHNDYLEQASDSGFPGFMVYSAFVTGWVCVGYAGWRKNRSPLHLGVWVGLLAWGLQAIGEFTLYIPSLAWVAFAFAGWLLGTTGKPFDRATQAH